MLQVEKLRDIFVSSVIESNYYRIGNIFYFLKAKRLYLNLYYGSQILKGRIYNIHENRVSIIFRGISVGAERKAVVTFEALNRYYFCDVMVLSIENDRVVVQFPEMLRYVTRRLYPRVSMDDLFMRFIIIHTPVFSKKSDERSFENRHPVFFQEIKEDAPSIRVLYQLITAEIKELTGDFELLFFEKEEESELLMNIAPDALRYVKEIILNKGKSVLIEDTSSLSSYTGETGWELLENFHSYYQEKEKELGDKKAEEFFSEIQKKDIGNFHLSYLIAPFTLFDYPAGALVVRTNVFDKKLISPYLAEEVTQLLKIFSYAMTKVKIKNSHFDPGLMRTRIVNISMSGLLMEFYDGVLYEYVQKHKRIKMQIPLMGDELEIYGEIIRAYEEDGAYYFGVLFFKSRPGDMVKLEQFIFDNRGYQFF